MSTELKTSVVFGEKLKATGKGHTDREVAIDYFKPLGDDTGFTSLELLMVSLCSCTGHVTKMILEKMQKRVEGMEVRAVGKRQEEHPTVLTDIRLFFQFKGGTVDGPSIEKAVSVGEENLCPVWAMLKNSVSITWEYAIG